MFFLKENVLYCIVFNVERVILSREQVLAHMVLKPHPYPGPPKSATFCEEAEGDLKTACGVCKDLARMICMPQPNRKWPPAPGSNPGLDHESQPLTIGPFLAPEKCIRGLSVEQLRHTLNIYCSYLQFINMRYWIFRHSFLKHLAFSYF